MPALRLYATPPERRKFERRKLDRRKIQHEAYLRYKEDLGLLDTEDPPMTKETTNDTNNTQGAPKHS